MTNETLLALAQQIFASQPFSGHMGARLVSAAPGKVEIALPIAEHLTQQHGYVHGGAISYLADNTLTFAGGLALGGDALTSEFKINYVSPGRGETLIARAEAVSTGKRQAVCRCDIVAVADGVETLCALAQGTILRAG